jgi:hypothetical protein
MKVCRKCDIEQADEDFRSGRRVCKSCDAIRVKKWHDENKAARKGHQAKWLADNLDQAAAANRKWAKENPAKVKEKDARRRAAKLNATPLYADRVEIDYVYHAAQVIKDTYGTTWEVDHIIPLAGTNVCGFHIAENLQILPTRTNRRKSNKFEAA